MLNLSEISNGTKLLLGAGILLLIDSFLAWQEVTAELGGVEIASVSRSGWSGIGIAMGLALIALLAWVLIQVLNVKLDFDLLISEAWLTLGLGVAVFGLAVIKLITILGDAETIWSYVGVALAALVAVGSWMRAQELRGIAQGAAPTSTTPSAAPVEPAPPATPAARGEHATPAESAMPAGGAIPTAPASPADADDTMPETQGEDDRPPDTRPTV